MSARVLVGDHVRIVPAVPGDKPRREGYVGKVVDYAEVGRAFLVRFSPPGAAVVEDWYEAERIEKVELPAAKWMPPGYVAAVAHRYESRVYPAPIDRLTAGVRAAVAEPEGHDDHLDAIEARLVSVPLTATRTEGAVGSVVATSRVAFVPKGGA